MQIVRTGRMTFGGLELHAGHDELRFSKREKAALERARSIIEEARSSVEQYAGEGAAFEFARAACALEECMVEGVRLPAGGTHV